MQHLAETAKLVSNATNAMMDCLGSQGLWRMCRSRKNAALTKYAVLHGGTGAASASGLYKSKGISISVPITLGSKHSQYVQLTRGNRKTD